MNAAVILSGGNGTRIGAEPPKQYRIVAGKPMIVHTLKQFQLCGQIDFVVVVAAEEWKESILAWKERYGLTKLWEIAPAGVDRQESILNGLLAARPYMKDELDGVVVQEAVRPLTSQKLLVELLRGLLEAPCVMPVLPVTDTIYMSREKEWVDGILDRSVLYIGQAPEAFHYQMYLKLCLETPEETLRTVSGSSQLPYQMGWKVKLIPGELDNFKITYPADLEACERKLLLNAKENAGGETISY